MFPYVPWNKLGEDHFNIAKGFYDFFKHNLFKCPENTSHLGAMYPLPAACTTLYPAALFRFNRGVAFEYHFLFRTFPEKAPVFCFSSKALGCYLVLNE